MKTREIVKAVLFVAGVILLVSACNKKDDGPQLDFDIKVPTDWKYYIVNQNNTVYYAQSPLTSATDSVIEDLVITRNDGAGYTLQSFYNSYLTSLNTDTTFEAVSSKDTTINGVAAKQLIHKLRVYAINSGNGDTVHLDAKLMKYFMMNSTYAYVLSFNALESTFNQYRPVFDTIASTFKFKY
jgi:hypothetical protein